MRIWSCPLLLFDTWSGVTGNSRLGGNPAREYLDSAAMAQKVGATCWGSRIRASGAKLPRIVRNYLSRPLPGAAHQAAHLSGAPTAKEEQQKTRGDAV